MQDWMSILEDDGQLAAGLEAGVGLSLPHTSPSLPQVADRVAPALPGMDAALDPLSEAQIRSAEARRIFEATEEYSPWFDDFWKLLDGGWKWRQAVYMLWEAQPPRKRKPKTQAELATEVLGLTSDRVISQWKKERPEMLVRIAKLTASALAKARSRIFDALIKSASDPNPRNHPDRKMALMMTGDLVERQGSAVGIVQVLEQGTRDELAAGAELPEWIVVEGAADA